MEVLSITPIIKVRCFHPYTQKPISTRLRTSIIYCSFSSDPNTLKSDDHRKLISMLSPVWSFVLGVRRWVLSSGSCCGADKLFDENSNRGCLKSGGLGTVLLSMTSTATVKISPFVVTLAANPTFVSGLVAWAMAQWMKVFLNFFLERKWKFGILFESGGMPSSHCALCTALTTSVALCHGVGDSLFPLALGFSLIVMYDANGVRRHAGMQAEVLNLIVEDLFQGHPISKRKLKELLGHTMSQVIVGALLGIVVACYFCHGYLAAA